MVQGDFGQRRELRLTGSAKSCGGHGHDVQMPAPGQRGSSQGNSAYSYSVAFGPGAKVRGTS